MEQFIKKIAKNAMDNPDKDIKADDIYLMLKYGDVKRDDRFSKDIEKFYQEFLTNLSNSLVKFETRHTGKDENTTHYIGFYVDSKAVYYDAVKVYFSVKYEYVISALKSVFMYLIRNNIQATVKFYLKATSENIVIRFYNKEDALPFINYCNNNFELRELLEKVNPFIATIYGIGIAKDDNSLSTYNKTLSSMLEEYIKALRVNGLLGRACTLDFLDYLMKRFESENNEIIRFNIKAIINNINSILNQSSPII